MKHNDFVRFFKDYVTCENCGEETRGRVYTETQAVVCSKCKEVIIDVGDEQDMGGMVVVTFIPEFGDGEEE